MPFFTGIVGICVDLLRRLNLLRRVGFAARLQTHQRHARLLALHLCLTLDTQHLVTQLSSALATSGRVITLESKWPTTIDDETRRITNNTKEEKEKI